MGDLIREVLRTGRITIGEATEGVADRRGRVEVYPEKRDAWVGAYIAEDAVYVCPVPFVVFRISRGR